MPDIAIMIFNPFRENTYVVSAPGGECIVVDPGNSSAAEDRALVEYITKNKLRPVMVVATHGHVDHVCGAAVVCSAFSVPLAMHPGDRFLAESAGQYGALYGLDTGDVPQPGIDLADGQEIKLGEVTLRVIHTPGHSPGHVCLFHPESRTLLCGDTLFRESIGRTDLPGGDYRAIMQSILGKIVPLGGDVEIYPGHGPKSTIAHETAHNPFITEVIDGQVNY